MSGSGDEADFILREKLFGGAKQITGIGEGEQPLSADFARVPAYVAVEKGGENLFNQKGGGDITNLPPEIFVMAFALLKLLLLFIRFISPGARVLKNRTFLDRISLDELARNNNALHFVSAFANNH